MRKANGEPRSQLCRALRPGFGPLQQRIRALGRTAPSLPWNDVPINHAQTNRGHGRIERRTIQVLPAPEDLPFPKVNQVTLIERYVTDLKGNPTSAVAVLGITSLTATRADPALLAALTRNHWGIESLHWLRDTRTSARSWTPCRRSRSLGRRTQSSWRAGCSEPALTSWTWFSNPLRTGATQDATSKARDGRQLSARRSRPHSDASVRNGSHLLRFASKELGKEVVAFELERNEQGELEEKKTTT